MTTKKPKTKETKAPKTEAVAEAPAANTAPAEKPAKVKKEKPVRPQLEKHSDEYTIEEAETFLTTHGHMGEGIERPADILGYLIEGVEDKTFKQGKRTVKAKKVKPVIEYDWQDTKEAGRQVFTSRGTAQIAKESADKVYFQVTNANGTFAVKQATTRFKAVNEAYRDKYVKDNSIRTASGSPSIHTGDDVSNALLGLGLAELAGIAKENGLTEKWEGWKAKELDNGFMRMNLGNVIRGMLRRGEAVTILGKGDLAIAGQEGKKRAADAAKQLADEKAAAKAERDQKAADAKEAKAKAKAEAKQKSEEKAAEAKAKAEAKKTPKAKPEVKSAKKAA